ncbi:MAG TPA: hypothetical protein VJ654_12975 [Noviherbaspirillum sp.]|nr:hypothetical protein [Noviherbaspirillum sp.]
MTLDLSEHLNALLADIMATANEAGYADAITHIASNNTVRSGFIEFCQELREAVASELALVEFGPVKGSFGRC